jgi:ubiquinone/menaquinone biosynthesis C-methylase UbiE
LLCAALSCSSKSEQATTPAAQSTPAEAAEARNEYKLEGSGPELYEKILVPPLFTPWADDLIRRVDIKSGEKVLDVATGTGIVARRAAAVVGPSGTVTALDINPAMLGVARKAPAPEQPAIKWVEGDALILPFGDGEFDVVMCQQAMQFFQDRKKAVHEMFRVLARGGRVALASWRAPEHNPYGIAFARVVERRVSPEAGKETRSPFAWDNGDEMAKLLKEAGFKNVKVEAVTLDMTEPDLRRFIINDLLAYPSTGKAIAGWSEAQRDALVEEILAALAQYKEKDGSSWKIPWASNVGVATK